MLARSERQADAIRGDLMAELTELRVTADRRLGDTLARVDTALGTMEEIRGGLDPVPDAARATLKHADRTVVDIRSDVSQPQPRKQSNREGRAASREPPIEEQSTR